MKKFVRICFVVAVVLIALSLGGFFYLEFMHVDCDQFSCIGFFIILVPLFLFGMALLGIISLATTAAGIYKMISKRRNAV